MILSHGAPSSLNMSSYRAIWTWALAAIHPWWGYWYDYFDSFCQIFPPWAKKLLGCHPHLVGLIIGSRFQFGFASTSPLAHEGK